MPRGHRRSQLQRVPVRNPARNRDLRTDNRDHSGGPPVGQRAPTAAPHRAAHPPRAAPRRRTGVRCSADAHGGSPRGSPGVGAELVGYSHGVPLRGSPLYPDSGPTSLTGVAEADPAPVLAGERASDANAYTFTLPTSWES